MAIHDLKAQIARLPEQPGVYLYFNQAGDTLYVGKARALRDRVRSYLGAWGMSPRTDALLDEVAPPRGDRHRLGDGGAGAREQPDQAAQPEIQHPAARRQELPVSAAHDGRAVPAGARRASGGEGRPHVRRPVSPGEAGTPDDGADASAVRHPFVQRGDHRQAWAPVPRIRHPSLCRPVRGHPLLGSRVRPGGRSHATVSRRAHGGAGRGVAHAHGRGRRSRTVRTGRAAA